MAESADARVSKTRGLRPVRVRPPLPARCTLRRDRSAIHPSSAIIDVVAAVDRGWPSIEGDGARTTASAEIDPHLGMGPARFVGPEPHRLRDLLDGDARVRGRTGRLLPRRGRVPDHGRHRDRVRQRVALELVHGGADRGRWAGLRGLVPPAGSGSRSVGHPPGPGRDLARSEPRAPPLSALPVGDPLDARGRAAVAVADAAARYAGRHAAAPDRCGDTETAVADPAAGDLPPGGDRGRLDPLARPKRRGVPGSGGRVPAHPNDGRRRGHDLRSAGDDVP